MRLDADKITRHRWIAGLTQADLAAKAGVSESYLSMLMNDRRGGSPRVAAAIAAALGVDVADILTETADQ